MLTFLLLAGLCLMALGADSAGAAEAPLAVWDVNPLDKLFPDAAPPAASGKVALRAARGQTQGGQLAIRVGQPARVSLAAEALAGPAGRSIPADAVRWHFQGFIPLTHNTPNTPDSELLRKAPCEVPDVLLPDREMQLAPGRTQPVWVGVDVPDDCPPGDYRGRIRVQAGDHQTELPLEVRVYDFALPRERHLWVTNWFNLGNIAKAHKVELWSEPFWAMLSRYAQAMAAHRQNVALAPLSLVQITRAAEGALRFDFSRFDRFVRVFLDAGAAERIELGHVASFGKEGWSGKEIVLQDVSATDAATGKSVSLKPADGLAPLLSALQEHLRERGWLQRAMIHVADEPSENNLASWRQASAFVHQCAPEIRRIDAIECPGFEGALEVWVPKLSHLNVWYPSYRKAQQAGAEMWFYTCCHPTGLYPNRFLDFSLLKTRQLHWLNYAYDLPGYLHWGLNFWGAEPFGAPSANLPPGDTHILYPGPDGPLSSLRYEAMREGIEDYEWLRLLAERTARVRERLGKAGEPFDAAEGAHALARMVTRTFVDYERSPLRFAAVREQLAREIEDAEKPPLLLVSTDPPAGTELVPGPINVIVRGACAPGGAVTINGATTDVDAEGRFVKQIGLSEARPSVIVEATRDGKSKRVVRSWAVRR